MITSHLKNKATAANSIAFWPFCSQSYKHNKRRPIRTKLACPPSSSSRPLRRSCCPSRPSHSFCSTKSRRALWTLTFSWRYSPCSTHNKVSIRILMLRIHSLILSFRVKPQKRHQILPQKFQAYNLCTQATSGKKSWLRCLKLSRASQAGGLFFQSSPTPRILHKKSQSKPSLLTSPKNWKWAWDASLLPDKN